MGAPEPDRGEAGFRAENDAVSARHHATFVISTGRCGTQWLAHILALPGVGAGRVEHEPLGERYRPRVLLGAGGDPAALAPVDRARVERHLAGIEATLEQEDYFEAGFPCWSALPYLARRFAGRLRIVHLTRHPVPVAYSWMAHGAYVRPQLPQLPEKILLHPTDRGVAFPEYAEAWPALHPWERALYYWAEVHAFALQQELVVGVPWLRLGMKELFSDRGMERLAAFLGLSASAAWRAARHEIVDEHHCQLGEWIDPQAIDRHPRVLHVARALGYDPMAVDIAALKRRYAPQLG